MMGRELAALRCKVQRCGCLMLLPIPLNLCCTCVCTYIYVCVCVWKHLLRSYLCVCVCVCVCVCAIEEWNGEIVKKSIYITSNEWGCQSLKCSAAPNNLAAEYSILIGGPRYCLGNLRGFIRTIHRAFYCCPSCQYEALLDLMRVVCLSVCGE